MVPALLVAAVPVVAVAAVATIAASVQVSARHQDDGGDNVPPSTLAKLG